MRTFLSLNYGSSSLKYALFEEDRAILRGSFQRTQGESLEELLDRLSLSLQTRPDLVAHRVVHGMEHQSPMLVDEKSLTLLEELARINPLHNALALVGIRKSLTLFPHSKHYALFDTDFHGSIPPYARVYGVDYQLYQEGIKRYGFHGLSYSYLLRRAKDTLKKDRPNLIIMHLGQGCSICAIKEGLSVDTSMGFSPLEGLMMVSRPGDLDPGVILELLERGYSKEKLKEYLYKSSGIKAIAGVSNFEELLQKDSPQAKLALEAFIYRLFKYVGSYWFVLEGKVDALVFSGGIGENSPMVRQRLCSMLYFLGIQIDPQANQEGKEVISSSHSSTRVLLIKTDEELEMVLRLREHIL
ncbi:MAG: acetate/propionate family kinase [Aquificaceae bacterium]|nr:acetate/propionate family kinase [Aquificaceae bacterium]